MKLLLIGCGNIGSMLLRSWATEKKYDEIIVVQPSLSQADAFPEDHIHFVAKPEDIAESFAPDATVIALKPQQLAQALPDYKRFTDSALFITVATGAYIKTLNEYLGGDAHIIRVMPNVAMQVNASATLAFTDKPQNETYKQVTAQLFEPTGPLFWLEDESLLEVLTPIAGSGPAYFFLLAQLLIDQAVAHGIDQKTASDTVRQMLLGSALLAEKNPDLIALKKSVTSKGGCTEAALKVLEPNFPALVEQAIANAHARQIELGS